MDPLFDRLHSLRAVPLFAGLSTDDLVQLAERAEVLELSEGAIVFRKGEAGRALYVVLSGECTMHDGERLVSRMGAGELFGELAVLDRAVRTATAVARGETRLLVLRDADVEEILATRPEAARAVVAVLAARLRASRRP